MGNGIRSSQLSGWRGRHPTFRIGWGSENQDGGRTWPVHDDHGKRLWCLRPKAPAKALPHYMVGTAPHRGQWHRLSEQMHLSSGLMRSKTPPVSERNPTPREVV